MAEMNLILLFALFGYYTDFRGIPNLASPARIAPFSANPKNIMAITSIGKVIDSITTCPLSLLFNGFKAAVIDDFGNFFVEDFKK